MGGGDEDVRHRNRSVNGKARLNHTNMRRQGTANVPQRRHVAHRQHSHSRRVHASVEAAEHSNRGRVLLRDDTRQRRGNGIGGGWSITSPIAIRLRRRFLLFLLLLLLLLLDCRRLLAKRGER